MGSIILYCCQSKHQWKMNSDTVVFVIRTFKIFDLVWKDAIFICTDSQLEMCEPDFNPRTVISSRIHFQLGFQNHQFGSDWIGFFMLYIGSDRLYMVLTGSFGSVIILYASCIYVWNARCIYFRYKSILTLSLMDLGLILPISSNPVTGNERLFGLFYQSQNFCTFSKWEAAISIDPC